MFARHMYQRIRARFGGNGINCPRYRSRSGVVAAARIALESHVRTAYGCQEGS